MFAALGVLLWVCRQWLLVPLIRPRLEAALARALGAERVSIGALEGDWFTTLDAKDITIDNAGIPLRNVRGVRIEARYSLAALLAGDLSGLRAGKVIVAHAELDLRPGLAVSTAADRERGGGSMVGPARGSTRHSYEPLLGLCAEGATVRIDDLHLLAAAGERRGAFTLVLDAGAGPRHFVFSYVGLGVDGHVLPPAPGDFVPRVDVRVDAEDPGAMLDLFGLGAGVREGRLHAEVLGSLDPPLLEVRHLSLSGLAHGDQRLERTHVTARLDAERLSIARATLDLPGLTADLHELILPSPFGTRAFALTSLTGRFLVRIDDLSPHVGALPAPMRALLPIRGRFAGSVQNGTLWLDAGELHARGVDLSLELGSLALAGSDWQTAAGSLRFASTFTAFAATLPAVGPATIDGRVSGTLAGSLALPQCELQVALGECRTNQGWLASAEGRVRADSTSITIEGLQVRGLGVAACVSQAPTSLRLDASCRLQAGRIDPDSLVAAVEVESLVAADVFAPVLAGAGSGPAPATVSTLQLRAHHDGNGITIEALSWRTASGAPVVLTIDGDGIVPLHWSGAGFTTLGSGVLVLRVAVERTGAGPDDPTLACGGTLRLAADSTELRELTIHAGEATLRGEVVADRGVAAILAGDSLATILLRGTLDLDEVDLERLPAAWVGGLHLRGRLTGHVQATGTAKEIEPEVQLTLVDGELSGQGMPALTGIRLEIDAKTCNPATKALQVSAKLSALLDQDLVVDRRVVMAAHIRCDETGTTLAPTVLQIGGGQATLQLTCDLRRSDLLAGAWHAGKPTLSGKLALREFGLDKLPPAVFGGGHLRGIVSGEIDFDGALPPVSVLDLVSNARLALHGGDFRLPEMPRFEQVEIALTGDRQVLSLDSLTGMLGAGRLSAQGSLRAHGGTLADSLEDANLELRLVGDDVLLYRSDGTKVRANVNVTATGTLRAIDIGGEVALGRGSKYVRRISLIPDLGAQGSRTATEGLRLALLPPAIGERLRLDVAIKTNQPFAVRTSVFDGDLELLGHLRGNASNPHLEGAMSLRDGMLRFPGANLRITSGLLTFNRSEPLFPELLVQAEGRRMGFTIAMTISGRYDRPQLQISSVPPLTQQELIVLLTTGQLPSTLGDRGVEGNARFVGGFLAKEVFEAWFGTDSTERGESVFDRLTIESGREISKNGTESLLVEYGLSERLGVQIERDAHEDYNLGIVLRFRFR